jgi:gas vesicle protein
MSNNSCGTGACIFSFALGAALGAGLALLFAPKSGTETRTIIREKSEEIRDRSSDLLEKSKDVLDDQKEKVYSALEAGKTAYQETRDRILGHGEKAPDTED